MLAILEAVLLVGLLIASPAAHANYFDTGNDYWAACFGKNNIICEATAGAFLDMMNAVGYKCSATGVSRTQAKDVLLKYMADHPEDRNIPASVMAVSAFAVFNC